MLAHVLDAARALSPAAIHVVVGHGAGQVQQALDQPDIHWVQQQQQLGTGHAVLQALPAVAEDACVLVLYGDVPLLSPPTLQALVEAAPALLTARLPEPTGYGRILRDAAGELCAVVEHKDATAAQREIDEVNTGVLAMPAADLKRYLPRVGNANAQAEYYLPDVLPMAVAEGGRVATIAAADHRDVAGVNDRAQLAELEREYQHRQARALLAAGVTLADPQRLDVRGRLHCGSDVFIDANVLIEGEVTLGDGVHIGPNCVLRDCQVGAGSTIHAMSHLERAELAEHCSVGPFARLRPGTVLAGGARIGNFVETKNSTLGAGSKVNHLSYVGDAALGAGVNVGAGTITCNYDGVNKHRTTLGDRVFVGSNSTLVAPLDVAAGGFIAAGSTVTRPVAEDELAVGRARQRNITGWQRPGRQADGETG